MRPIAFAFTLALTLAAATGARTPLSIQLDASVSPAAAPLPKGASVLFTLAAKNATLTVGADPATPNAGHLHLGGVSPRATWFTERPVRRAGTLPTATLVSAPALALPDETGAIVWLGAPNVAVTGTNKYVGEMTAVVTFRGVAPQYDGEKRTLSVSIDVIPQPVLPGAAPGAPPVPVAGDGKPLENPPAWAIDLATAAWTARREEAAAARAAANVTEPPTAATLDIHSVVLFIDQADTGAYLLMPGAPSPPPPPQYSPSPPPPSSVTIVSGSQCLSFMSPGCSPWSGWYGGGYGDYYGYGGSMTRYQTGIGAGGSGVAVGGMEVGLAG